MTDKLQKLDEDAPDKPLPLVTEAEAVKAIKELNLDQKFSVERKKAEAIFGQYQTQSEYGVTGTLIATGFHSLSIIEETQRYALEQAKIEGVEPKDRAALLNIAVIATKALPELMDRLAEFERKIKKPAKTPSGRNAAPVFPQQPQVLVQGDNIHIHEAQQTATPASVKPEP